VENMPICCWYMSCFPKEDLKCIEESWAARNNYNIKVELYHSNDRLESVTDHSNRLNRCWENFARCIGRVAHTIDKLRRRRREECRGIERNVAT